MSPIIDSIGSVKGFGWGSFVQILNSFESIATSTVGSGGSASVTFSSIPSTYTHLQVRYLASTGVENNGLLQFNSDTTSSNYRYHSLEGNGASAYANQQGNNFIISYDNTSNADNFSVAVVDILDYANTNKYKTVRTICGFDTNGGGVVGLYSLLWMNTNAITSIVLKPSTGSWKQDSHFALYGIKGA